MGFARAVIIALKGRAKIEVINIAFEVLERILSQFFRTRSSDKLGIITTAKEPTKVKGKKRRGITIPFKIPNRLTA